MNSDQLSEDSIFKIGKVTSVDGRSVCVRVDKTKNSSHLAYKGELLKNVSVGGYIKIVKGFTKIIGKVEGEFIKEDKVYGKKEYGSEKEKINRLLTVSLLGFFNGIRFERGIKELPLIDNEAFLLHSSEFDQIHNFLKHGEDHISLGNLSLEKGQEIKIGVDSLFASHIGIFGNTGSGKSYTLAKLYRELFRKYKDSKKFVAHAKFFLIDFNGEYVDSEPATDNIIIEAKYKNVYRLSTRLMGQDKFPIKPEMLNDPDFWTVFLEATEKTQTPFLRRAVDNGFIAPKLKNTDDFKDLIKRTIFSAVTNTDKSAERTVAINFLNELRGCVGHNPSLETLLDDYKQHLQFHSQQGKFFYQTGPNQQTWSDNPNFKASVVDAKVDALDLDSAQLTLIDQIRLQIVFQYYDDTIKGFANKEHLAPLIKRLDKRVDNLKRVIKVEEAADAGLGKSLTIVSLRDVNVHMRKILPLLLCKMLYAARRNQSGNYLNIIIDEAHNILSQNSERESEQWKDYRLETFEEIIKEGRKFGVFLTIASQRPSDISPTIISQLHNYFLHRLINNEDIKAVEKTISYLDKVSFEYLPILPTGTCILAGLLANIPVIVDIGKIEGLHEPKNKTLTLADKWK